MATKRQRRKRRRRYDRAEGAPAQQPSAVALDDAQRARAARRRAEGPGPPPPPWGSFPLTEIVIFVGIVLLIAGFFVSPPQGFVMLAVGLVLGSLGGLELSIREHFAGYRSHTLLLGGAIGVPVFGVLLIVAGLNPVIALAAGALAFGAATWVFARSFRRRSGGALYRFRGG